MKQEINFKIGDLLGIGMTMIVLGIGLAYGLEIMGETEDTLGEDACEELTTTTSYNSSSGLCYEAANISNTASPTAQYYNSTGDSIDSVTKLPEKLPTIATVIVAAVIIGILVTYLFRR